jgi:hypothetical protein
MAWWVHVLAELNETPRLLGIAFEFTCVGEKEEG